MAAGCPLPHTILLPGTGILGPLLVAGLILQFALARDKHKQCLVIRVVDAGHNSSYSTECTYSGAPSHHEGRLCLLVLCCCN